jgi:toxin ParE1/3/4
LTDINAIRFANAIMLRKVMTNLTNLKLHFNFHSQREGGGQICVDLLKRPEAESGLGEIWWYIAQDGPHNADRFLDRIHERCWALADFPQMGTNRDELKAGLRLSDHQPRSLLFGVAFPVNGRAVWIPIYQTFVF